MSEKVERKKSALREEFGFFDDPRDTFEYIIAKTKTLPRLPDDLKKEEYLGQRLRFEPVARAGLRRAVGRVLF